MSRLVKAFSMLIIFAVVAGCSKSSDPGPTYAVQLSQAGDLGTILTDGNGRTLYYFSSDFDGKSACNDGTCVGEWPVFHHNESLSFGAGLTATDFATITRADGTMQTTYKGWPLYYFAPNFDGKGEDAGKTLGQGGDGNTWFVMKPDYGIMLSLTQLIGLDGNHYKSDFTKGDGFTQYMSDAHGGTIYLWINDRNMKNNFTNADYTNTAMWSLYYADLTTLSVSGNLNKSDFSVITVGTESRKQLTYKGNPMYQYVPEAAQRGSTKGVSIPATGPLWHTLNSTTPTAANP